MPTVNHTINEADQKFPVNIHLLGHREAIIHFFSDMVIVKVRKTTENSVFRTICCSVRYIM